MTYYVHNREHSNASEALAVLAGIASFAWVFALIVALSNVVQEYKPDAYNYDPVDVYIAAGWFVGVFWLGALIVAALVVACFVTRGRVVVVEHEGDPGRLAGKRQNATNQRHEPSSAPDRRSPRL